MNNNKIMNGLLLLSDVSLRMRIIESNLQEWEWINLISKNEDE